MDNLCRKLMLGGSTAALFAVLSVAGAQAQDKDDIEQVVVSASRITIAGYQQPTPVTVVGAEALAEEAKADLGDAIRELPAVQGAGNGSPQQGSNSVTISGAPAGQSNLALRGLGLLRTLVLFDGQRVVQSNITGGVDLDTIPSSLVQRVDIVTGGASAAWGSDAVAGVVNLVLNKNFDGFKASAQVGDDYNDTYRSIQTQATWGGDIFGGRGHIVASASFVDAPDTVYSGQAHWFNKTQLVPNPTNSNELLHENNIGQSQATPGGLITASPAVAATGTPANAFANIAFEGSSGTPTHINPGNVAGAVAWGGALNYYTSQTPITEVADPYRTKTLFFYGRYKITDSIQASLQLNFGQSFAQNSGQAAQKDANLTIKTDNAYLDPTLKAQMTADGISSFTMGTLDTNNCSLHALTVSCAEQSLGIPVNNNNRQLARGVFTLEGALGDDWSWNAYYQHSESRVALRVIANTLTNNLTLASDAVRVTATGADAAVAGSGLSVGSIACRSTLTAPTNGCVPLDVFGEGVASPAAIAWINSYGNDDYENITLNEDVASGSMQGTLPWKLPAGAVAVVFGTEYRKEGGRTVADPRANAAQWASGNFANFAGQYNIIEGFGEVDAPILKDQFVQSLDFNGAGRMTSYSTSGLVETWKLGLTSQVNDDIRLRTTYSTDIRAPDLSEFFASAQVNIGSTIDLHSPSCTAPIGANGFPTSTAGCGSSPTVNSKGGNLNLVPESARTVTGGVVLTPTFIDGLSVSLDWYSISIAKAISTLGGDPVQCAAQVQVYCNLLSFTGANYGNGKPALVTVFSLPVNAAEESTSGLDMQLDYPMDLFTGRLNWHLVGNYNDEHTLTNAGVTCDFAGQAGTTLPTGCGGGSKLTGVLSSTYVQGPMSFTLQTRFFSSMRYNSAWVSGVNIDDNDIGWKAFLDVRGSYQWNDMLQFYAAADDITNSPPRVIAPIYTGSSYQSIGSQSDNLGRVIRIGVRISD